MSKVNPNAASFLVTEDCNLACTYCFELGCRNKDSMTKEIARKGLEFLAENAIKDNQKSFSAMIFGGEPLLKLDIVEEILRYGIELGKAKGLYFQSSIVTNATIMNDDLKRIVSTYKSDASLSVQLSIDGIKEVHDRYRVTKDGKGSFELIEKNIEDWKMLFQNNMNALSVHGCLNKESLPFLYESYKFFRTEWNIPRIWFMPIHAEEWTEEDITIYDEQLTKIADFVLDCAHRDGNTSEVYNYAPIDKCMSPDQRPGAPCGAGKNFITITAKGMLSPCHHFYFNDPDNHTMIGDLWEGIDEDRRSLFIEYDNDDLTCAKEVPDCDAYGCYRCIADNWVENGSILSVIRGVRCKMSFVERKIQLKMREELQSMGLMNKEGKEKLDICHPDYDSGETCKCNLGGPALSNEYDTVQGAEQDGHICRCDDISGDDLQESVSVSESQVLAEALHQILEKIDTIEKGQAYIFKKLL